MTQIIEIKELLVIGIIITFFVVTLVLLLLFYERTRRSKYDAELRRAELEKLRESYENKIYQVMERLTSTEERWRDLNHLIISAQKSQSELDQSGKVKVSRFLKNNGVSENDTIVDKDLVFVLTPFHENYLDSYNEIERICRKIGLKCLRGDEENITEIFPHILRLIAKSRLIIANIDGRNPNVFYELGIAHAIDKPVILISSAFQKEDPASQLIDVKSKRMIIYKSLNQLESQLTKELGKALV